MNKCYERAEDIPTVKARNDLYEVSMALDKLIEAEEEVVMYWSDTARIGAFEEKKKTERNLEVLKELKEKLNKIYI